MLQFEDFNMAMEAVTIRQPADIARAAAWIAELSSSLGLRVGATVDISSREHLYDENNESLTHGVLGWSVQEDHWWERPTLALKSPIALACRYESGPFWCNNKGAVGITRNPYLDTISFERFFDSNPRINALMMVPARVTFGRIGAAAFSPVVEDVDDLSEVFARHSNTLSAIIGRFLGTYAASAIGDHFVPSNCSLTSREVQCLYWASRGKTDQETAIILGVSHAAVRYHISKVTEKLDAVNRAQAVFKAGQLGYLGAS